MDKNNDNKSTGLDGLNGESKTEFLRLIWNSTTYQICLAKMVFDDHGAPVDYIILDINPAYEKAFGFVRDQAINKRVTELFPYYAHKWIEKYPSLIFLKDECGRYVYLNRTYEQQFVGSKNWYGRTDFDFWSKESAELFRANDQAVLETGRVTQYLEDSKDLDGTRYCWLNYKFPYTDSKIESTRE